MEPAEAEGKQAAGEGGRAAAAAAAAGRHGVGRDHSGRRVVRKKGMRARAERRQGEPGLRASALPGPVAPHLSPAERQRCRRPRDGSMLCGSTAWARRTTAAFSVCVFSPPLLYVHSGEEQGGGRGRVRVVFYVALKQLVAM